MCDFIRQPERPPSIPLSLWHLIARLNPDRDWHTIDPEPFDGFTPMKAMAVVYRGKALTGPTTFAGTDVIYRNLDTFDAKIEIA